MRKLLAAVVFLVSIATAYAQTKYEPEILILAPNKTGSDPGFEQEISDFNKDLLESLDIAGMEEYLNSEEFESQPENIQQLVRSEIEFTKEMDFYKRSSSISAQYLAYRFFEKFPNLMIRLKNATSDGSIGDLKKQSEVEELQYVLNFPSVEIYEKGGAAFAELQVQLFDRQSDSLLLDKSYTGDWSNPGFEFACENQTIHCTLNNALSEALGEVLYAVASNSPTLLREKQLQQERFEVLLSKYFQLTSEKELLSIIIETSDDNIDLTAAYKTIFNEEKDKFVAFFAEEVSPQDFKDLTQNKKDKNVQIISGKDIKDPGFLEEVPRKYAYIVKGVQYDNRWYYTKDNVTYFEAGSLEEGRKEYFNNLQQWNYFKENTASYDPQFWETGLFEKIRNLKKDPKWEDYGDSSWKTREINDRPYIGLYEIVADELRKENRRENEEFAEQLKQEVFKRHYEKLEKKSPEEYSKISEHSLIFSKDRKLAINPVSVTSAAGIKKIRYFVAFKDSGDLYEWTYFEPLEITSEMWGSDVVNQIGSLTDWTFSVDNLDDADFWQNYVLAEENGGLKYLKKIE